MSDVTDTDRQWHLDKKVPIALIATLGVQTMAIVWWAAGAAARLDQLERQVRDAAPQAERVIRLEEKISVVQQGIGEIKVLLGRGQAGALGVRP